jgi:hypothetical protein
LLHWSAPPSPPCTWEFGSYNEPVFCRQFAHEF